MKTRNGFVSNSSSSSFVVHHRKNGWIGPNEDHQTILLSKEQLKKLKKFGFKYSNIMNPHYVRTSVEKRESSLKKFKRWEDIYLTYDVTCNQDNVIYFLLSNKIPFVALCHYEEELVTWDGKCSHFYQVPNTVEIVSRINGTVVYDVSESQQYYPAQLCPKIKKYNIDEWMKNEVKWTSNG